MRWMRSSPRWVAAWAALATLAAPAAARAQQASAYVLTTDYSSGSVSCVDLSSRTVHRDVATVFSDARMRVSDGLVYVINRFGQDNIQVLDPARGFATLRQFSVGNGSNPQDLCIVSPTKAYVTRLASPRLLVVNPATGDSLGAVSLAAFADADGIPEMDRMILVGDRLFVSLERLSNFQPTDTSLVAVVDVVADTVVDADPIAPGTQAIVLPGLNPVTPFFSMVFFPQSCGQPSNTSVTSAPWAEAIKPLIPPPTPARHDILASPVLESCLAALSVSSPTSEPPEQGKTSLVEPPQPHFGSVMVSVLLCYLSSSLIASVVGTRPADFTTPSTAKAGVIITPISVILLMSVIFSMRYSMPNSLAAASACS